jgi:hypothetical protein
LHGLSTPRQGTVNVYKYAIVTKSHQVSCCDDDWKLITFVAGTERVAASMTFTNASGDIDLRLYDPSGVLILATSNFNSNDFENIV